MTPLKTALALQKLTDVIDYGLKETAVAINKMDKTINKHNGRLASIEAWKERMLGGKLVIKGLWSVLGVFLVGGIIGLWNMYIQLNEISNIVYGLEERRTQLIQTMVSREVSTYFTKE